MKDVKRLAVVGAGTAGLAAALILKTRLSELQIDIIRSKNIGIVGVGEGSTEQWKDFLEFLDHLNINFYTFIKECDATFKVGILFKDWTDVPYMHTVQSPYDTKWGQYHSVYAKQISSGAPSIEMSSKLFWENKVDPWYIGKPNKSPVNQYHFNTYKLNDFLSKLAVEKGITIIDDEILDVNVDDTNNISSLKGEKQNYNYDFYLDCTGFKRMLISKLGGKWKSHSKYLKMNAAFAFPTEEPKEYNTWTLARGMDAGWMFRIPTWGRMGNGYIYDSNYISQEDAKLEAEKYLGHEINIGKEFKFDPGVIDKTWINNCCAIGLSASFFEPLEASSIGTSIQQCFILMHKLINYDQRVIDQYNKLVENITDNIRDYLALHYMTDKKSSQFWRDQKNVPIPDSLQAKLDLWKYKLPIKEDFSDDCNYILFKEANFIMVMHGLGLFDQSAIRKEYEMVHPAIRAEADHIIAEHQKYLDTIEAIPHKEALSIIRESV